MTAVISPCGAYRYHLTRVLGGAPGAVVFIGVNPSTADATTDDATVRKWIGFTRRWGVGAMQVGNLFAYRATDVRQLGKVTDPVGPDNDRYLRALVDQATLVVPCWGSQAKLPARARQRIEAVRELLRGCARPVKVLGLTASGDPRHPLFLGYDTTLEDWTP
jgi:hypothetical protein